MAAHICHDVALVRLCSVTFISVQNCIMFSPSVKFSPEQSPKFWVGSKCKLCGGQCMCKNDVSHILSQMKPNIIILEYGIRKKKNPWWKNLVIRYVQVHGWPHFWAPGVTKPRPPVHPKARTYLFSPVYLTTLFLPRSIYKHVFFLFLLVWRHS